MDKTKLHLVNYPVIEKEDVVLLKSFLKENNLPYEDIQIRGNRFFLYLGGGAIVGCGGLEFHGDFCLLRSVAVSDEFRGQTYGKEIVNDLISRATDESSLSMSLLTETAQTFFEKFGFKKVSREGAPQEIKSSSEFTSVCPVSAVYMSLDLQRGLKEVP